MALTIKDTPDTYSSVHDCLVYTVLESTMVADPDTYPNFKYIADVYVNGALVARIRKIPDPTYGFGVFDVSQIVRNYVSATFEPVPNALVCWKMAQGKFYVDVQLKFGYEYDFTSYYDVTVDDSRVFYNNYNARKNGYNSDIATVVNDIASRRPNINKIIHGTPYLLIPYFPTNTTEVPVIITPSSGSVLNTSFTPAASNELHVLNLSPSAINNISPGKIPASLRYYTVEVGGQAYRFNLTCEAQYQVYMLHFLNRYGGFESRMFNKVSRTKFKIDRETYGRLPYEITNTGAVMDKDSFGVYLPSRSVYSSQQEESMTLNTDFLTDAEYKWLSDLIFSTMVFLEDAGYFYPVVITNSNYEPKKSINDDLTNLSIDIDFGQQLNAQYR